MKIKFLAGGDKIQHSIQGSMVNGINTSLFTEGSTFLGSEETLSAGIFDMFWDGGELHVVLAQSSKTMGIPWGAREGEWIDGNDYDPSQRYIAATNPRALALLASGEAEYWQDPVDGKWTVRYIEAEQEPAE
ncbi:hypothetical protein [Vreelandella titanicae]|uniref:hypothetical protein n=1 Tax=Vreelandella titanicae TaxID=664683 RepID=UPI004043DFF2